MADNVQSGTASPKRARTFQFENTTRGVYHLPWGSRAEDVLVIGDKEDTDDKVPRGAKRDEKYQPSPVRILTDADLAKWSEPARAALEDLVRQGFLRRTELAAA